MTTPKSNPLKIVDVSEVNEAVAKQVLEATQNQGFLFVDGHDFTQQEVDLLFQLSRDFFKLPREEKIKHPIDSDDCGYTDYGQELLDTSSSEKKGDPKEAFNFGRFSFNTGECHNDSLPELFVSEEEFLKNITKKFYKLSMTVLRLLAIGLEIDETKGGLEWFSQRHKPDAKQITAMRFLHYPSNKSMNPETQIRAGAHTDYGTITLLFQQKDEEGLELYSELKQKWELVPYIESPQEKYNEQGKAAPIIVNIADELSFWTGGLLKSTKHRVVLPQDTKDRYSIVFFLNADNEVELEPIPSDLITNNEGVLDENGQIMTSIQYLTSRFNATYIEGH